MAHESPEKKRRIPPGGQVKLKVRPHPPDRATRSPLPPPDAEAVFGDDFPDAPLPIESATPTGFVPIMQDQSEPSNATTVENGDDASDVLGSCFRQSPPWVLSMVVHSTLLIILSLIFLKPDVVKVKELFLGIADEPQDFEQFKDEPVTIEQPMPDAEIIPEITQVDVISPQDFEMPEEPEVKTEAMDIELAAMKVEFDPLVLIGKMSGKIETNRPGGKSEYGFGGRTTRGRRMMVQRKGGTKSSEKAVESALKWLAEHQLANGAWSFDHQHGTCRGQCSLPGNVKDGLNGATGFGLLPFLGAGYDHKQGKYKETVYRGLRFLIGSMNVDKTGGNLVDGGNFYSQGVATIALTEAYGMTRDRDLNVPAQMALNYIIANQDPKMGGWGYQGPGKDTSIGGWQIMALKSGDMAYLQVPPRTFLGVHVFLNSVGERGQYGLSFYGYNAPGKKPSTTAIGLLSRMCLGWKQENPALAEGIGFISQLGPNESNMYYNYYATQLMFQYTDGEGPLWQKWNETMREFLVNKQSHEGHESGSWGSICEYTNSGGRLYATSMATMTLEVYYRLMPVYRKQELSVEVPIDEDEFPLE